MTATPGRPRSEAHIGRSFERTLALVPLAEVALTAVTLAVVFGQRRLFVGMDWFDALAAQAVLAHLVAIGLRRARVPVGIALPLLWLVGLATIGFLYAGDTMWGALVPTADTIGELRTLLGDAWGVFDSVKAPTEPLDGFLIASSVSIWMIAGLADWSAFRLDAPFEAVLPSSTLFVLAAILGSDSNRLASTVLWVGAIVVFLLFRRAERLGHRSTWVGSQRRIGPTRVVQLGGVMVAVTLLLTVVVADRIPGAESEAVVSLKDLGDDGPGTRVTISPLVDIRSRLVDQPDVEVFTVRSDVRSYWRLTSLDRFDGRIWSSNGSFGKESGGLPEGVPVASERIVADQDVNITALSQIWIPAAYEPTFVSAVDDVRYDEVSGTLIVDTDTPTSNGQLFRIRSALPVHDPALLAQASTEVPDDVAERYLPLPADFSPAVAQRAAEVTAAGGSTYERMTLLQNFFRDNFTYNLEIGPGHDERTLERFVFETQEGYCEQFAGAFAAMARSLGIPSRVAVGFTPGVQSPGDPGLFSVRGEHAHAWPEVYLGEYGWVAFEPTPGRGAPFAEQYTGVPEQQAASGQPGAATTVPTTAAPTTDPTETPSTTAAPPQFPDLVTPDELPQATGGLPDGGGSPWPGRLATAALVFVAAVALYLAAVPAFLLLRHRRRRARASAPDQQVGLAWEESLTTARISGIAVQRGATHRQVASVVGSAVPGAAEPMRRLAGVVESSTFAPEGADEEAGTTALALADAVRAAATSVRDPKERLRDQYDPRRLRRNLRS